MNKFDLDNNKVLDINEFGMFIRSLDSRACDKTITDMFNSLDVHHKRYINLSDLNKALN
jgi:Ca2+-binding EF-hand superfamily protein